MFKVSLCYWKKDTSLALTPRLTFWFNYRPNQASVLYYRHLLNRFKTLDNKNVAVTLMQGNTKRILLLEDFQSIIDTIGIHCPSVTDIPNALFDIARCSINHFRLYCPYCGNSLCILAHEQVKFLETVTDPNAWMLMGYDLAISQPQATLVHTSRVTVYLLFIWDLLKNQASAINLTTSQLFPSWDVCEQFKAHQFKAIDKKVLPLRNWCLRALWKRKCDLSALQQVVPLSCWKDLKYLARLHPLLCQISSIHPEGTLHQIQN